MHGCAIKARDRARSTRGTEIDRRREKGDCCAVPHYATPRHGRFIDDHLFTEKQRGRNTTRM